MGMAVLHDAAGKESEAASGQEDAEKAAEDGKAEFHR
jgi:hypothetical protein